MNEVPCHFFLDTLSNGKDINVYIYNTLSIISNMHIYINILKQLKGDLFMHMQPFVIEIKINV